MPRSLLRLLAVLAAALMLLGACGDDDGGTATPPADVEDDAADDAADAVDDVEGGDDADGGEDADADTDEAAGEETDEVADGPDGMPNLAAIDDFCGLFGAFSEVDDPFALTEEDMAAEDAPAAMEQAFQYIDALFTRATDLAPDELQADMALLAEGMSQYNELLAEYDYDFMAMAMAGAEDPEAMAEFEVLDSEEFEAASLRIEEYVMAECGIDLNES